MFAESQVDIPLANTSASAETVPIGLPGTPIFHGFLEDFGEYNPQLEGLTAIRTYEKMRRSDAQVAATLLATLQWPALLLAPRLARTAVIGLFLTTPYVRSEGLGSDLARHLPAGAGWPVVALVAFYAVMAIFGWPVLLVAGPGPIGQWGMFLWPWRSGPLEAGGQ